MYFILKNGNTHRNICTHFLQFNLMHRHYKTSLGSLCTERYPGIFLYFSVNEKLRVISCDFWCLCLTYLTCSINAAFQNSGSALLPVLFGKRYPISPALYCCFRCWEKERTRKGLFLAGNQHLCWSGKRTAAQKD